MLNSELDLMHQRYATLEDQILVLSNDNQRLKDASAVNKLYVKELNDHLHHLKQEI
jgi:predicted  nucleic acid-binding Zn-ribbon protein